MGRIVAADIAGAVIVFGVDGIAFEAETVVDGFDPKASCAFVGEICSRYGVPQAIGRRGGSGVPSASLRYGDEIPFKHTVVPYFEIFKADAAVNVRHPCHRVI